MKVLVLGGTGAMGVYLVPELLNLGYEVYVTSRSAHQSNNKRLHYIVGNAMDTRFVKDLVTKTKFDAIVDFMVYHTWEFRARAGIFLSRTDHYIFLSSYRAYGDNHGKPIVESSPRLIDQVKDKKYLATDEYGLTKGRQENILGAAKKKNWTVVRPAITYSKERFQLGTMEAQEFLYRALNGKSIIFAKEMLDKQATMSWAGDVAKMIARLILNPKAYGQYFTVATAEHHPWREVVEYYKDLLGVKVKIVSLEKYTKIIGRPYQIKYDRMYDRIIDNKKILKATGLKQEDLMPLYDGLKMELANFSRNQRYKGIDEKREWMIDGVVMPNYKKVLRKISPMPKIKQIKAYFKAKDYDGAIVSLTGYYNYGGLIQRYALQEVLRRNGYKYKLFSFKFMIKMGRKVGDRKNLEKFAMKYLDQERFDPKLAKYYKSYIVGSDQVWRDWFKDWNKFKNFFLSFASDRKVKRIAYAASFGVDTLEGAGINAMNKKQIKKLLKKFDKISVREDTAERLVRELGPRATTVLDPTLLLTAADYSKLINDSSKISEVFYYLLDPNAFKKTILRFYEKKYNTTAEGIYLNNGQKLPPMEKWLKGFRDSKFVVTDSFHGMVFSIINHKAFVVLDNAGRGSSRMYDLLSQLGLESRILRTGEDLAKMKPIDWKRVDTVLNRRRRQSKKWLMEAVKVKKKKSIFSRFAMPEEKLVMRGRKV